jgi:hypothetical protein
VWGVAAESNARLMLAKQLLDREADVLGDLSKKRWRDVTTTMKGHRRPTTIVVAVLTMGTSLTHEMKSKACEQCCDLARLEDRNRRRGQRISTR